MSHSAVQETVQRTSEELSGKYLLFSLGNEDFGLEIIKVREIIGYMNITPVPGTADYVKGVINLRGSVIPVTDLRSKFGMPETKITDQTCIVVVEVQQQKQSVSVGLVIDQVREVMDITAGQIDPAPRFDTNTDMSFILGMGKINDHVKTLLNIDKVLNESEFENLNEPPLN